MTTRHQHTARVVGAFVRIPAPLRPGDVRCLCGKSVRVNAGGTIRRHKTPKGDDCTHRAGYGEAGVTELPPVVMPLQNLPKRPGRRKAVARPPSRLDVGSACLDCSKWIPGERSYCGQCARKRDSTVASP